MRVYANHTKNMWNKCKKYSIERGCRDGMHHAKNHGNGVIPNQFSKHLHVTPLELNQIWYVCSTCGFMKPDKILLTVVVWFPGYGPLKIQLFKVVTTLASIQIPITFPFLIVL